MSPPTPTKSVDADLPKTILVVEDEGFVRMVIADYLRDCGYHVVEAASGDEAKLVLGADSVVDLVFSDIQMPGKADGFALACWVREQHPSLPVILTSGWAAAAEKARDLCHEGSVISKPYEHTAILQRIQSSLQNRQAAD